MSLATPGVGSGAAAGGGSADVKGIVAGNSAFAIDLHRELACKEGNLFHSPFSVSTALSMTYAGARGNTAREMAEVLHLPADPHEAMGELVADLNARKLRKRWRDDPNAGKKPFELVIANALWGQQDYPFVEQFVELTQQRYGAGLIALDFRGDLETSRQKINGWVEEKTNDKIKEPIQEGDLTPDVRLVLTNAIYFKSAWDEPFEERCTREETFYLASGKKADVKMMHRTSYFESKDAGDFDIVKLPYQGNEASMVLMIPKKADGLAAIESRLTAKALDEWLGALKTDFIALGLPRFKYSSRFVLNEVLQVLGMTDAFVFPDADFKAMSPTGELYIGFVITQSFVDVNEDGTEAAAATVGFLSIGIVPATPRSVTADKPFLFLIRDEKTGSILFVGRVADPRG